MTAPELAGRVVLVAGASSGMGRTTALATAAAGARVALFARADVLTEAVLPTFRHQHDGLLLHISSSAANKPDRSCVAYQASKAGAAALALQPQHVARLCLTVRTLPAVSCREDRAGPEPAMRTTPRVSWYDIAR